MKNKQQPAASVGIIGGADGPTGIFIADRKKRMPLRFRVKKYLYDRRRRRAEKQIAAGTHTLEETVAYASAVFGVREAERDPDETSSVHIYTLDDSGSRFELEVDYTHETFGVSFTGDKKVFGRYRRMAKELYLYYGVSEQDIRRKTPRYYSLLGMLSQ